MGGKSRREKTVLNLIHGKKGGHGFPSPVKAKKTGGEMTSLKRGQLKSLKDSLSKKKGAAWSPAWKMF